MLINVLVFSCPCNTRSCSDLSTLAGLPVTDLLYTRLFSLLVVWGGVQEWFEILLSIDLNDACPLTHHMDFLCVFSYLLGDSEMLWAHCPGRGAFSLWSELLQSWLVSPIPVPAGCMAFEQICPLPCISMIISSWWDSLQEESKQVSPPHFCPSPSFVLAEGYI